MLTVVAFAGAAAAGALARWQAGRRLPVPLGTLSVNVIGAFALGLMSGLGPSQMTVIGAGGLGALTTFSTLAAEVRDLADRAPVKAAAYLAVTLAAGLAAAWVGLTLSEP